MINGSMAGGLHCNGYGMMTVFVRSKTVVQRVNGSCFLEDDSARYRLTFNSHVCRVVAIVQEKLLVMIGENNLALFSPPHAGAGNSPTKAHA